MSKCQHKHKTLCGRFDPEASYYVHDELRTGMFVAWQCDDCGLILQDDVDEADLYRDDLPALDFVAHQDALAVISNRQFPQMTETPAMQFFAGAIR